MNTKYQCLCRLAFRLVVFTLASAVPITNAGEIVGTVLTVIGKGENQYSENGHWLPLRVGTPLAAGMTFKTAPDGQVDIFLRSSGSVIRLKPATTLMLEKLLYATDDEPAVYVRLKVTTGRVLGNVQRLSATSRFEIISETGTVALRQLEHGRGTEYDVSAHGVITVNYGQVFVRYTNVKNDIIEDLIVNSGRSSTPPGMDTRWPLIVSTTPERASANEKEFQEIRERRERAIREFRTNP